MDSTTIGGRNVSMVMGPRSTIEFSSGAGDESGWWEFWKSNGPNGSVVIRCRPESGPGERFERMMTGKGESELYARKVADAAEIVPASETEIEGWLNDPKTNHPTKDAPHAIGGTVAGNNVRVTLREGAYCVERT